MTTQRASIVGALLAAALVAAGGGPACAALVAHYTFDGATGTEDSAGTHDGDLKGARGGASIVSVQAPGAGPGNRVLFVNNPVAGFEDYAQRMHIADHPDFHFTNKVTIALWVYGLPGKGTHPRGGRVVDQSWQFSWSLQAYPQRGEVHVQGPGLLTTGKGHFTANRWHHIAFVYDYDPDTRSGTASIYVDAKRKHLSKVSGPLRTHTREILLGATKDNKYSSGAAFHGYLDDVRLYNEALTQAQIAAIQEAQPADTVFVIEP